ncbi:hypothetical protein [Glaciihabitans sp. dw_435]|uniref:hypothetical protein n=1 Tax=Glaciihabitans sp. dw_435 TaxID=2720081 RepID=UPI001BD475E7|nr:hypothetical protein [Glaciihabitans sp. dw_435]
MTIASTSRRHLHRSASDIVVARFALFLLRWSHRRAERPVLTAEEVDLMRRNAAQLREEYRRSFVVPIQR